MAFFQPFPLIKKALYEYDSNFFDYSFEIFTNYSLIEWKKKLIRKPNPDLYNDELLTNLNIFFVKEVQWVQLEVLEIVPQYLWCTRDTWKYLNYSILNAFIGFKTFSIYLYFSIGPNSSGIVIVRLHSGTPPLYFVYFQCSSLGRPSLKVWFWFSKSSLFRMYPP